MKRLTNALNQFSTLKLDDLGSAHLMKRMDTKFILKFEELPELLNQLNAHYSVLTIDQKNINSYKSLYFDTTDFKLYADHHNRKDHRFKLRYRTYLNSNQHFLEIKEKRKGKTDKKRIAVDEISLTPAKYPHLNSYISKNFPLTQFHFIPVFWNTYERITLVDKSFNERVTLDFNVQFYWEDRKVKFDQIVIAELKQSKQTHRSFFYQTMKNRGIRPYRISKYCLGILNLHKDKAIKYNRFKKKLLKLNLNV